MGSFRKFAVSNRHLAFHPSGKPRGWVRWLLFKTRTRARWFAHALVFHSNGAVRPAFSSWYHHQVKKELSADAHALLQPPERLESVVECLIAQGRPVYVAEMTEVRAWFTNELTVSGEKLLIALTHDNYLDNVGGVQTCVRREAKAALEKGIGHLVVFPQQHLPRLAEEDSDPVVGLIRHGELLGFCRTSDLTLLVRELRLSGTIISFGIHQLLGHSVEKIGQTIDEAQTSAAWLWLHDFFTICPSYALLRNRSSFCGAPPLASNSCNLCIFGQPRHSHYGRMKRFFEARNINVVAPSMPTLDIWNRRSNLPASVTAVQPHLHLEWGPEVAPIQEVVSAPIRVAHLGMPTDQKGWRQFLSLSDLYQNSAEFEFISFGIRSGSAAVRHVLVGSPEPTSLISMKDALLNENVDIVLNWPTTFETFSLTTFEALESGAFIITNAISGNVAATVGRTGRGVVLRTFDDLVRFFSDGKAQKLAIEARNSRAQLVHSRQSGLTVDLIEVLQ